MSSKTKRNTANNKTFDRNARYGVEEALTLLKAMASAKFDETVEIAVKLGVDPRKSDQMIRGVAKLPHGTGKEVKVLVFAMGEAAAEAKAAGADFVGAEDLTDKIKEGWLGFDKAIATPDMMPKIAPIARILGPRGLMPNPKVGTVTRQVGKAVIDQKAGSVQFRAEKAGIVHAPLGRLSFDVAQLRDNFSVVLEQLVKMKPATSKGIYMQSITISSTMGPGLHLDIAKAQAIL